MLQLPQMAKKKQAKKHKFKYSDPVSAVGGASPQQPPITRWDYNGFAVIFERDRVVDAVATSGEPPSPAPAAAVASTS